jgi:hypothetical protein
MHTFTVQYDAVIELTKLRRGANLWVQKRYQWYLARLSKPKPNTISGFWLSNWAPIIGH